MILLLKDQVLRVLLFHVKAGCISYLTHSSGSFSIFSCGGLIPRFFLHADFKALLATSELSPELKPGGLRPRKERSIP